MHVCLHALVSGKDSDTVWHMQYSDSMQVATITKRPTIRSTTTETQHTMMITRPNSVTRLLEVFDIVVCSILIVDDSTPLAAAAGAAAFFAMREYEKHQEQNGQPPSHEFAKELMAGIAGAEVLPSAVSLCLQLFA